MGEHDPTPGFLETLLLPKVDMTVLNLALNEVESHAFKVLEAMYRNKARWV